MVIHVILFCSFFEYTSTNIVSEVIPCSSFICGSQQELGSCTTIHIFFGFLITLLLTLLQVNYQKSGNPFETHGAIMLLFIIVVFVYTLALAGISQPTSNASYLPILRRVFYFWSFCMWFVADDPCTPLWMVYPWVMYMHVCTITFRVTPTDSLVLWTNFPINQTVYFSSIQHIGWLVPK